MKHAVQHAIAEIEDFVVANKEQIEAFRLKYLSRKGQITEFFEAFKQAPIQEKKELGQLLNTLKNLAQSKFDNAQEILATNSQGQEKPTVDLTLPTIPNHSGSLHPLTLVRAKIVEVFARMGFNIEDGPEIESDWYNFSALNFADNHPAREMQDTFFVQKSTENSQKDMLLRTHTSNVQIRLMEYQKPPLRSIMIGRVFRNEAISARAHCMFHQCEGLYVAKDVSFSNLKDTLYHFSKEMFGQEVKVRFRPSYFPFTEPSAEMDISCLICKSEGCNVCKQSGWVEILGCGMVDPAVLENCGIDSNEYTGFAFGMGLERIAQLKYRVNDLRLYTENDVRFLRQFEGA